MSSDGVKDVDVTYRRLLALKKELKKDAVVAKEVLRLLGRDPSKGVMFYVDKIVYISSCLFVLAVKNHTNTPNIARILL